MAEKRIMLIESGQFIGGVIHNLFQQYEQLSVIEAAPTNWRELLRAIKRHRPEIVVLDDTVHASYLEQLLRYMQHSPGFRVVVMNTDSNQVSVYEKQQYDVRGTADFFAIL